MSEDWAFRCRANAKLNLTLECRGTRDDGYHLLDMIMCSVDLHDTVKFRKSSGGFRMSVSGRRNVPIDDRNLIFKALAAVSEEMGTNLAGLEVHLVKRIPSRAGMGGGSADAAAAIIAANEIFGLRLSADKMLKIGARVGADVPFCLTGGTAKVTGIGEIIEPCSPVPQCGIVVMMPEKGNSTPQMFKELDRAGTTHEGNTDALAEAVAKGDIRTAAAYVYNDFAPFSYRAGEMTETLMSAGALGASVTGSGAAVFGIFETFEKADTFVKEKGLPGVKAYACRPAPAGIERY